MADDVNSQRHADNITAIGRINQRIDKLSTQLSHLDSRINMVKDNTKHLDECFDRFQLTFADMSEKFIMMYSALKFIHSPRQWMQDNWIVVIIILILFSLIPNVPTWLHTAVVRVFSL